MNLQTRSVSFVFPVYNEEYIIAKTIHSYYNELKGKLNFEIIAVEDGSTDDTKRILKDLESELSIRVYLSEKRKGYLQAIKDSLKYPRYEWVFLVDSDSQFDPKDFWKLWEYADRYDVILGKKIDRKDGALRSVLSKGYNFLLRRIFKVSFEDMDTGFRLIKKSFLDDVAQKVSYLQFFNAEFVIRVNLAGAKIIEVPVNHFRRQSGKTNIFYLKKIPAIVTKELIGMYRLFGELKIGK
ncbi:MAG: glycosyltransferase family 2 protein [Patescibacteria group bacterium]